MTHRRRSGRSAPRTVRGPTPSLDSARPKYVGVAVKRLEDPRLLTGAGRYAADIRLDRMVHLAFLRSDQAHARIVSIATGDAKAVPGVLGVFTADDFADIPAVSASSRTRNYHATANPILAKEKVRYVGEPVAVVVAASRYVAEDALALIAVDYEQLDLAADAETAAAPGAPLLHEDLQSNVLLERTFRTGEPEQTMARCAHEGARAVPHPSQVAAGRREPLLCGGL